LNLILCHYFFGREKSTIQLWKTKKFQLFNHHVLEELSLMAKFRFAKSIAKMPKGVAGDVDRLNALRNGLAHAFFPENLKRSKPEWAHGSGFLARQEPTVNSSVYFYGGNWIPVNAANTSYIPPNFLYAAASAHSGAPSDLTGYWSFDSAWVDGTALLDQSSYMNNATAYNISLVPGEIGQAIQLNGVSSYAQVPSASSLDLVNDLTLSALDQDHQLKPPGRCADQVRCRWQ
jgi:hypothetical protein